MSHPTFLEVLKAETMKFQATHPEREAEIARASALIRLGMVTPSPDDPATGQVLSSDGQTVYRVNGVCDCEAGQHGRQCKHVSGWRLYQHIASKVAAPPTPDVLEKGSNLPEARASVNVRVQVAGHEVQWTLRDHSEDRLATRLAALLGRYPVPQPAPPSGATQGQEGYCAKHQVPMKLNHGKDGKSDWYSHRHLGEWCKGK
jgi:hypothetical protein